VGVDVELEPVLEPLLDHVEVQLAHAGDDQLVRLGVASVGECRVLVGDLGQPGRDFRLVLARLRLDGAGTIGVGELDRVEEEVGFWPLAWDVTVSEMCRSSNWRWRPCRPRSPP